MIRVFIVFCALFSGMSTTACSQEPILNPALAQTLPSEPLSITTMTRPYAFMVEVARTRQQRGTGLMHRGFLADDRGMLFDFSPRAKVSMWMKFTFIPLDMLFIAPDGRIVHIEEDRQPHDETPVGTDIPVAGVLELAAGSVKRLGIRVGDRVNHAIFGNAL